MLRSLSKADLLQRKVEIVVNNIPKVYHIHVFLQRYDEIKNEKIQGHFYFQFQFQHHLTNVEDLFS